MQANPPPTAAPLHSSPVYAAASLNMSAAHHLVFVADAPSSMLGRLLQSAGPNGAGQVTVVDVRGAAADDLASLKTSLQASIAQAHIGTHLYLLGRQSVVWALQNVARELGMQSEEISLLLAEGTPRSVYCVHCARVQELGEGASAECAGCGVRLFVREHFSRRLGAFMGVCEDADHPYARPAP